MQNIGELEFDSSIYSENGDVRRLPSRSFYEKIELKNYRRVNDRVWGDIMFAKDSREYESPAMICALYPTLLIEMIHLRKCLPDDFFNNIEKIRLGSYDLDKKLGHTPKEIAGVSDEKGETDSEEEKTPIDLILDWCAKNGFPFSADELKRKRAKPLFDLSNPPKLSFAIADFLLQLNEIYNYFILYRFVNGYLDSLDDSVRLLPFPSDANSNADLFEPMLVIPKDSIQESKDKCKELFWKKYQSISFVSRIVYEKDIHIQVEASNLFDAAFYQLAQLLNAPNVILVQCEQCHKYFTPQNMNEKFCGNPCTRQQAHRRREAAKKRATEQQSPAANNNSISNT